jgi:hypothetical protein
MYHDDRPSERVPVWLLFPIVVVVLAAIIGDPGGSPPRVAAATQEARPVRCLPVPDAFLTHIRSRTSMRVPAPVTLMDAAAFVSASGTYLVAIRFNGLGPEPQVGVWLSRSLIPGEQWVYSANGLAKSLTSWPDAVSRGPLIHSSDPRIAHAQQCLQVLERRT